MDTTSVQGIQALITPYSCGMLSGMEFESRGHPDPHEPPVESIKPLLATVDKIREPEGEGHSQLIFICGVSGVGKDTLVESFKGQLTDEEKEKFQTVSMEELYEKVCEQKKQANMQYSSFSEVMQQVVAKMIAVKPVLVIGNLVQKRGNEIVFDETLHTVLKPRYYAFLSGDPLKIFVNKGGKLEDKSKQKKMNEIEAMQSLNYKKVQEVASQQKAGLVRVNMSYHNPDLHELNATYLGELVETMVSTSS